MTETFYPTTTITGHESLHAPLSNSTAYYQNQRYGMPVVDGTDEEESISCFCGYSDDDGNTVACDRCNRWQHTICYYPQYEGRQLPEELQHFCVDCDPRPVDLHAARQRQRLKRDQQESAYNGAKRTVPKSHKKKVKEPIGPLYTNGWPMDKARHDRNSASPRDQPPPAKRPKTSHRNSDQGSTSTKGHARKRTATNANHRRSVSRSPDSPIPAYSDEFLRCFHDDEWTIAHSNVMETLDIMNTLSNWVQKPDEDFRDEVGASRPEMLMRWDGDMDDIPGKAQIELKENYDSSYQDEDGNHPMWKSVTVEEPVPAGGYIGELKGRIGFKDYYKADAANRWPLLRHPEPFVFFHQRLPIYIDARNEGTPLRFIRRSCNPNARLQILITDERDYHFCFMATSQIDPGMEIAIGWDTQDSIMQRTQGQFQSHELDALSSWVSNVLSNCGPCACHLSPGDGLECFMARFDRRAKALEGDEEAQPAKMPKAKKKNKAGHHISPLNTNAFSSRSGSEARKIEADDEPTDSRSASGSAGRGSASRDITPNTHYSTNGSTAMELSERERKKLAKEEEMFRRQEEEQSGKKTKKRNSAGSNVNTPTASTSKQFGSRYADAGTSKQSGLPSAKSTTGKRPRALTAQKTSNKDQIVRVVKRPKPTYVDADTQCDMDKEEADKRAAERAVTPRKKYISVTQRLLQRCAINNMKSKALSASPKASSPTDNMDVEPQSPRSAGPAAASTPRQQSHEFTPKGEAVEDVQMGDASPIHTAELHKVPSIQEPPSGQQSPSPSARGSSHTPADPPVPPWPWKSPPISQDADAPSPEQHYKPSGMHIDMPPPSHHPFAAQGAPLTGGMSPNNITGSIAQSPASLMANAPLFSPAVTAAVTPSPARKKLSLSDYTKRSKAVKVPDVHQEGGKNERDSSPASVASGPVAPPLQASASDAARAGDDSSAIEEDVKMEDAGGGEATVTASKM